MHITHGLRRCQRLLPHLNNTGGFFVAILRKTRALPGGDVGSRHEGGQQRSPGGDAPRPSRPGALIGQSGPVLWRLSAQETCSLLALDPSTMCDPLVCHVECRVECHLECHVECHVVCHHTRNPQSLKKVWKKSFVMKPRGRWRARIVAGMVYRIVARLPTAAGDV
jgi:hypothetical protein